jgi:mono/diheme cytochrome c family protein
MLPRYQQECSACHVAYPPGLLPASSWQRLLSDLPHHFGTDASLDPAAVAALSSWLMAAAGRGAAPPQDRITTSRWFVHEHDEVPAGVWQRPAVRSASNCVACHAQAEQGVFDEHTVRIPR